MPAHALLLTLALLVACAWALDARNESYEKLRDIYANLYDCDKLLGKISAGGVEHNDWATTSCNCHRRLGYYYERLGTVLDEGSEQPEDTRAADVFLLLPHGHSEFVVCSVDERAAPHELYRGVSMRYSGDAHFHSYQFDWSTAHMSFDRHSGVRRLSVMSTHHAGGHRLCHASVTDWSHDQHYWHLECHGHATPETLVAQ